MSQLYNPVTDAFTYYEPIETPKVKLDNPLFGTFDLSDQFSRISSSGTPIAKANTPETIEFDNNYLDRMAQRHLEMQDTITPVNEETYNGGNLIENEKFAYEYLIKNGVSRGGAAGIVGNLYHEGLANPTKSNKDSHGTTSYGTAQFNSRGELKNLMKWAKKHNIQGNPDFKQQLDFIIDVIKTRPSLSILLSRDITPTEASFVWGSQFERFAGDNGTGYKNREDSHHKKRAKRANKIFQTYG